MSGLILTRFGHAPVSVEHDFPQLAPKGDLNMSRHADTETMVDVIAARNGLPLPEGRKAAIVDGFIELEAMCARLRTTNLTAVDEPANVYGFAPITRIA